MTWAEKFNRSQIDKGVVTIEHITAAVRALQEELGVTVDGWMGEATIKAYDVRKVAERGATVAQPSAWAKAILEVATSEIGHGEEHEDNAGPDIHRYRDYPYGKDCPERPIGHWCAFFVGYCLEVAAYRTALNASWRRFGDSRLKREMPVGCAQTLAERAAKHGQRICRDGKMLATPIPGDIFSLHRGRRGSRAGHIGIIETWLGGNEARTIEGNSGKFPCKVRLIDRDFDSSRLVTIARL